MSNLISEKEAARLLDVSVHKLQKDRRQGSPLPFVKVGRSVKYRKQDIENYIEQQMFSSTSQYNVGGTSHGVK